MSAQFRARVIYRTGLGGGQHRKASLYSLELEDGRILTCDYVEIASDGFRTLAEGEEVWCSESSDDDDWATYVVPIRDYSPRDLLGLPPGDPPERDPIAELWL